MPKVYTDTEKLKGVERELMWRRKVYPNRVLVGRMSPQEAAYQISLMESIVEDYQKLAEKERLI